MKASRIECKCDELQQRLLISQDLLRYVHLGDEFVVEEKGEIKLRDKANRLRLYGVELR